MNQSVVLHLAGQAMAITAEVVARTLVPTVIRIPARAGTEGRGGRTSNWRIFCDAFSAMTTELADPPERSNLQRMAPFDPSSAQICDGFDVGT